MNADAKCLTCNHLMPAHCVVEREVEALMPAMYDRPDSRMRFVERSCENCGSTDLQDVYLCLECREAEAAQGSDYCPPCDVITEQRAHEDFMRRQAEARRQELMDLLVGIARVGR